MSNDPRDEGCLCQGCGNRYRFDFEVPDYIWFKIQPANKRPGAGLLCGPCIVNRIEGLKEFGAMQLTIIAAPIK